MPRMPFAHPRGNPDSIVHDAGFQTRGFVVRLVIRFVMRLVSRQALTGRHCASKAGNCSMSSKTSATPTSRNASGVLWPTLAGA